MRAVLDTNVLVSAFLFPGGAPEAVYRLALDQELELISSRTLLAELGAVLESKFGWNSERTEYAVAQLTRIATLVEPSVAVSEIAADPADNRVPEAAEAGGAEVIVSGDRHLLALGRWREISIEKPSAFLDRLAR